MFRCLLSLLFVVAAPAVESFPVTVVGTTPTQAILRYTSPVEGACRVTVREEGANGPVPDFDTLLFRNSGYDLARFPHSLTTRERTVIAGARTTAAGHTGRLYSRALQAATRHEFNITCGTDYAADGSFTTATPPLGNTYPELPGFSLDGFGNYAWPSMDWQDRSASYIDPLTGILLKRATGPGDLSLRSGRLNFAFAHDPAAAWLTPQRAVESATSSLAVTSKTQPLFLAVGALTVEYQRTGGFGLDSPSVDDLLEYVTASGSDSDPENRSFEICLSVDSGQSCASEALRFTAPQTNPAAVPSPRAELFTQQPFARWGGRVISSALTAPTTGKVATAGRNVMLLNGGPASLFHLDWAPGTLLYIEGTAPACPGHHCTVEEVLDTGRLVVRETLPVLATAAYRAANFGLRLTKVTATGSLGVNVAFEVATTRMFVTPANGSGDFCSSRSVNTEVDAGGRALSKPLPGYLCILPASSGTALYFFAPSTGETRLLSNFHKPYSGSNGDEFGSYIRVRINSFDNQDGRSFYGTADTGASHPLATTLWRGRYTGDFRAWQSRHVFPPAADGVQWTNLTPASAGRDVARQLAAASPDYDPKLFPYLSGVGVLGGHYIFSALSEQDAPCILAFFDVRTGNLVSSRNSWSDPSGRWGTCHTIQPVGQGDWLLSSINAARYPSPNSALVGPFEITINAVRRNDVWDPDTALTETFAESCPDDLDPRWQALGATGLNCIRVRISGEPCSLTPTAAERQKYPCPHNPAASMLQRLAEGDLISDFFSSGAPFRERFRVVRKFATDVRSIELVLQRRAFCVSQGSYALPASYFRHARGWRASMAQTGGCWGAGWWLNVTGTPGTWISENPVFTSSHFDYGTGPQPGQFTAITGGYESRTDTSQGGFGRPLTFKFNAWPTFAGSGQEITGNGRIETYPSLRQWTAPAPERAWALDFRAYQIGLGVISETPLPLFENNPRLLAGFRRVYQIDNPASGLDVKRLPVMAWAGRHWLRDISGPDSRIGDEDEFAFCIALRAGECRPEATPRQIYVNIPQASLAQPRPFCATNTLASNYPCLFTASPIGAWVTQSDVTRSDPEGLRVRRLTMGFSGPGRQYTYANARATPDGKWAFVPGYGLDGYRTDLLVAKLPPWPTDQPAQPRHTFSSQVIPLEPPADEAAVLVRVRFGYAENGPPDRFYCTSRQEACYAGGAPYLFAHENPAPLPCAAGCSPSLPAIPGRVLYYQVERLNQANQVLTTEPIVALITP